MDCKQNRKNELNEFYHRNWWDDLTTTSSTTLHPPLQNLPSTTPHPPLQTGGGLPWWKKLQQKVLEKRTEILPSSLAEPPPHLAPEPQLPTSSSTTTTAAPTTASTTTASTTTTMGALVLVHQTLPDLVPTEPTNDIDFVGESTSCFLVSVFS